MHTFFYCRKDIYPTIYTVLLLLCLTVGHNRASIDFKASLMLPGPLWHAF